jgi:hypothetical protein
VFANKKLIRGLVTRIRRAERETLESLRFERIEQEPALTDRLLGVMEHVLNGQSIGGITWTAKSLTDRGAEVKNLNSVPTSWRYSVLTYATSPSPRAF